MKTDMRWIVALAMTALAASAARAQVAPPALIGYDGILRNSATGQPFNGTADFIFTFYPDASSTGTDILSDAHPGVLVTNGSYHVELGGGSLLDGAGPGSYLTVEDLFRDFNSVWLEMRVTSPFVETLSPRVRLLGSAYAFNVTRSMNASLLAGNTWQYYLVRSPSPQVKSGSLTVGSMNVNGSTTVSGAITAPSLIVAAPLSAAGITLPNGTLPISGRTPQQIAALHWYAASTNSSISTGGGSQPVGVAFDGSAVWVTDNSQNRLLRFRAADNADLGPVALPSAPVELAFDGANIWVGCSGVSGIVLKIRASDGVVLASFTGPGAVLGITFDGANVWLVRRSSPATVTKMRASDGAVLGSFQVGLNPNGVAFDGANVWVANEGSNDVTKLRATDGALLGTFAVGLFPRFVAFDGASVWVTNYNSNTVSKLRASDGVTLGTFSVGTHPRGIAFDGSSVWVADAGSNDVTRLRAADGLVLGTYAAGAFPSGVAFDGSNIWVTNQLGGSLSKL